MVEEDELLEKWTLKELKEECKTLGLSNNVAAATSYVEASSTLQLERLITPQKEKPKMQNNPPEGILLLLVELWVVLFCLHLDMILALQNILLLRKEKRQGMGM